MFRKLFYDKRVLILRFKTHFVSHVDIDLAQNSSFFLSLSGINLSEIHQRKRHVKETNFVETNKKRQSPPLLVWKKHKSRKWELKWFSTIPFFPNSFYVFVGIKFILLLRIVLCSSLSSGRMSTITLLIYSFLPKPITNGHKLTTRCR